MPPDHGSGNSVGAAAALRGYRMSHVTGHRPQPSARQAGQQAFGDFMGADDVKRKGFPLLCLRVKVLEECFFKTGIMNDDGTRFHLIGRRNTLCGLYELVPDVSGRKGPFSLCTGDAGDALHRRGDVDFRRQSYKIGFWSQRLHIERCGGTGLHPADFKQMPFLRVGAGGLAIKGQYL